MSRWTLSGLVILLSGFGYALPLTAALASAPPENPQAGQPTLSELGKMYRDLELPLPPKDAGFACVGPKPYRWPVDHKGVKYELRFVFDARQPRAPLRIWEGLRENEHGKIEQTYPKAPSPDVVLQFMKLNRMEVSAFEIDPYQHELIFAVQCHLLGHDELANFFYWRCVTAEPVARPYRLTFDHVLAIAAWNFWAAELTNPVRDRNSIAKILKLLRQKYNVINIIGKYYGENDRGRQEIGDYHNLLLERLDLTLNAAPGKPGTVEWMVGKLAEVTEDTENEENWTRDDHWIRKNQIRDRKAIKRGKESEIERKLRDLGFEAIPVLIEHVDDKRLTRIRVSMNNGLAGNPWRTINLSGFTTVDRLVRKILANFFDLNMDTTNDGWKATKLDYLTAWDKMKLKTEAQFVSEKLANLTENDGRTLDFAMTRFPEKMIALYRDTLNKNKEFYWFFSLVYFIVDSEMPRQSKIELLTQGTRHKRLDFQVDALAGILELDEPLFNTLCLESLARLPKLSEEKGQIKHHLNLLRLALCTHDRTIQNSVAKSVKLSEPNLKIAMLSDYYYIYCPSKNDVILFFGSFLQDSDLYLRNDKDDEIFPGLPPSFEKIEVRNFAAYQILEVLEIDYRVDEMTPAKTWQTVRSFVKNEVDRRMASERNK